MKASGISSSFCTVSLAGPWPGPTAASTTRNATPSPNRRAMVSASARTLAAGLKLIITSAAHPAIMGKVMSMPSPKADEVA